MEFDAVFAFLAGAAFLAGLVDAVVGGGGLIQIPALLAAFPHTAPATLFGTNKIASIVGTSSAALQYSRRVRIPWGVALPGALAALAGAWFGARAVVFAPVELLRYVILALLILVAVYTFIRKDFGTHHNEITVERTRAVRAVLIGSGIGFYDGFFGPGTGSFLIFLLVRSIGMDFLRASVTAKIINVATNLSALIYFSTSVELFWKLGASMAIANLAGAVIGSRLALKHGSGFVRRMFLGVVVCLIAKLGYDLLSG
jgi:uncharacterized membrane protein YfcA